MIYKSPEEIFDKIQSTAKSPVILVFYFSVKRSGELELHQYPLDISRKELATHRISEIMHAKDFSHWCIDETDMSETERSLITEWYTDWSQK
jgi:hypothetical protein